MESESEQTDEQIEQIRENMRYLWHCPKYPDPATSEEFDNLEVTLYVNKGCYWCNKMIELLVREGTYLNIDVVNIAFHPQKENFTQLPHFVSKTTGKTVSGYKTSRVIILLLKERHSYSPTFVCKTSDLVLKEPLPAENSDTVTNE